MRDVVVTVDERSLANIEEVVRVLESCGMDIDQVSDVVITGRVDDVGALAGVDGVIAVELARGFLLPPPDADVQ